MAEVEQSTSPGVIPGPQSFLESIGIGAVPREEERSFTSVCTLKGHERHKEAIELEISLNPINYQDRITCFTDRTYKRYFSRVDYTPGLKSLNYSETWYSFPKQLSQEYVSELRDRPRERKWYTSSVSLPPRSWTELHISVAGVGNSGVEKESGDSSESSPNDSGSDGEKPCDGVNGHL